MWINVRTFCGQNTKRLDNLSKLTKVGELRDMVHEAFDVLPRNQKLFYRGKLMVDHHTLFDYSVSINDTIQLLISTDKIEPAESESVEEEKEAPVEIACEGLYQTGEQVDVFDRETNGWFEGSVKRVYKTKVDDKDTMYYEVRLDGYEEGDNMHVLPNEIRPRAEYIYAVSELKPNMKCMVNYNFEKEEERGYWYDALLLSVTKDKKNPQITARITLGGDSIPTMVNLSFVEDIFKIESRTKKSSTFVKGIPRRKSAPICKECHDNFRARCKFCSCCVCGKKENTDKILLCDECDKCYHLYCLKPKLTTVPEDEYWYCNDCKRDDTIIVQAGESLKKTKASSKSSRDWGKGMACQGRSKVCTIVPQNHVGPIPGVPVGSTWRFRLQVSEAGVHRPPVGGIHGRESEGAYSIVLSGGYEDDKDLGEEFYYTGSGGRDLSGNRRTAGQSSDQKLTKMNLALAKCCAAPINSTDGAEADNWKKGRPIRVVRSCKLAKHSKYAPAEGIRYDGIYKVSKYWPHKGHSGFLVWRYFLRRDDPSPPPWTKEGKEISKKLGLKIVYPEGYISNNSNKENTLKFKRKRDDKNEDHSNKKQSKEIDTELIKLINLDKLNKRLWKTITDNLQDIHNQTMDVFTCVCCTELVSNPITTTCHHNLCKDCLQRSFKAEVYTCPVCRTLLKKNKKLEVNEALRNVLLKIFPGYDVGR